MLQCVVVRGYGVSPPTCPPNHRTPCTKNTCSTPSSSSDPGTTPLRIVGDDLVLYFPVRILHKIPHHGDNVLGLRIYFQRWWYAVGYVLSFAGVVPLWYWHVVPLNINISRPPKYTVLSRSKETTPAMIFGEHAARRVSSTAASAASGRAGTAKRNTAAVTVLGARGGEEEEGEKPTSAAAMSGVGSTGSNILLLLSSLMVIKGLLLPENIR